MSTRVTSGGLQLGDTAFRATAPALAETARSLAGRAHELYELATGSPIVAGEPAITRPNPQGLIGWDLSGPPWGSALTHPVVWFTGRSSDANLIQPDSDAGDRYRYTGSNSVSVSFRVWCRPFEQLKPEAVAPLSRLCWILRSYRVSGATTVTATASTWNPRFGGSLNDCNLTDNSQIQFTTTAAESNVVTTNLRVNVLPGWNRVHLHVSVGSGTTSVYQLTAGALVVDAKRAAL